MLDIAEYSAFESTLNSPIVSYRIVVGVGVLRFIDYMLKDAITAYNYICCDAIVPP